MATDLTKADVQEIVDKAVETLALAVGGAFEKQREIDDEKLSNLKTELLEEIDSRGYVTKHDLDDAIVDAKDEILKRIDESVEPKLQDHEQRLVSLEQRA